MIDINLNLPIDTTPTDGSTNLIDSNAVFDSLELSKLHDVDTTGAVSGDVLALDGSVWKPTTISTGLTIGTTPITSGTVGRVLFEGAGNVVQEDSSLFWDNTNKRLGIGTTSPSAKLDVKAQGALSTDIAFRVRNSADTGDIINIKGDQTTRIGSTAGDQANINITTSQIQINKGEGLFVRFFAVNRSIVVNNGSANTGIVDAFEQYSADIVAGNAAPHFRTENGSVIKLYKQNLATNPTNAELATFLSNLGLANLI